MDGAAPFSAPFPCNNAAKRVRDAEAEAAPAPKARKPAAQKATGITNVLKVKAAFGAKAPGPSVTFTFRSRECPHDDSITNCNALMEEVKAKSVTAVHFRQVKNGRTCGHIVKLVFTGVKLTPKQKSEARSLAELFFFCMPEDMPEDTESVVFESDSDSDSDAESDAESE